ncbi:MAG: methionine adenosyltransferase [Dehalococcoidia bacterium]|jgi:S-adenosylmethionine synthetase|nr:methionine adenosyltransferase [Dehalococcoidia bacterium]
MISNNSQETFLLTSESVTEGHPDKVCDRIADSILDAILSIDQNAKVAIEVAISNKMIVLLGEISSKNSLDYESIAKDAVLKIGYTDKITGFDINNCKIISNINRQSSDIEAGVMNALEIRNEATNSDEFDHQGAGDQGIVFGYACNETETFMPMPIFLAHNLTKQLAKVRHQKQNDFLLPDGKAQVTIEYKNDAPYAINNIIVSTQHRDNITNEKLKKYVKEKIINPVLPTNLLNNSKDIEIHINPSGRFVIGGPQGDAGVTGRKIVVDTYGGSARHGGGAFSGKDPSKVDRTGAYMARYIAKNLVASNIVDKIEVQISYGIGIANPISLSFDCFDTQKINTNIIKIIIDQIFDCRPAAIINQFQLKRPIYSQLSAYGHFGRPELDLPWERLDKVEDIKQLVKKN